MVADNTSKLTQLGSKETKYTFNTPSVALLEVFDNKFPNRQYVVTHDSNEFTSLCPKTNQPDFANIKVEYIPGTHCVETKSLKLYLFSYRNEGMFMETIVNQILNDLVEALIDPVHIAVEGSFGARGGIQTTVLATYNKGEVE